MDWMERGPGMGPARGEGRVVGGRQRAGGPVQVSGCNHVTRVCAAGNLLNPPALLPVRSAHADAALLQFQIEETPATTGDEPGSLAWWQVGVWFSRSGCEDLDLGWVGGLEGKGL
jgi:hypothetical protein